MVETCSTCAYINIEYDSPYCEKLQQNVTMFFSCGYHTFQQVFDETIKINPTDTLNND